VDRKPDPAKAGPPVKALIVYNCNPAAVAPDQSAVLTGLRREDLFTVVLEHFQTDTADYADYVLPATTQLEHWDLHRAYGHQFVSLNRPAIPPVGQSLPNSEIFRRLAVAMGYVDPCFSQDDETILRNFVEAQRHPVFETVTWQRLLEDGFVRLNLPDPYLPFAQGNFPTPSGKCEFFSQRMADDGYEPVPVYVAPKVEAGRTMNDEWGNGDERAATHSSSINHSLICISPPAHSFLNTTFANVDRFLRREEAPALQIHPADAAARGIVSGVGVRVWNELGEVRLVAEVTNSIIQGTVLAPGIWWSKFSPDGRNINQITPQDETDMGASACFYDTRVFVAVAEGSTSTLAAELPVAAD
jgi:anaerobic selenocysteine-containing dehydrogenase